MKKHFNIKTGIIILAVITTLFSSCGYEPVFYGIMHDVLPEDATISGNIAALARCSIDSNEYLFVSSGGSLKYKSIDSSKHGDWKTYKNLPFELHHYEYYANSEGHKGEQILRVISDKDNIYLLTASYKTDTSYGLVLPAKFYLWTCPLSGFFSSTKASWKNTMEDKTALFSTNYNRSEGTFETNFSFFMTNTPKPEHRRAFFVTYPSVAGTEYYELNGQDGINKIESLSALGTYVPTYNDTENNKQNTRANSAFVIGSSLYFSDSHAVTTNETAASDATFACLAGVNKNYNLNSQLYTYDSNGLNELMEAGSTIASLALTADSLLIGKGSYTSSYTSNGGIERVLLNSDGKPQNQTTSFTNNATYQFTSAYIVMSLLSADPSKTEDNSCLYATVSFRGSGSSSSASFSNIGLWSYYPARGNWNRE